MKKIVLIIALLLTAAGYAFLQTTPPPAKLATLMPSGALLYLEAPDFGRLLRDWDASKVKADWLQSANYSVFSRSNLFIKLQDVYSQYGQAAGFLSDFKSVIGIAGANSALALYGIRDVEFLYISSIGEADLAKSRLWAVRDKFERRRAGGVSFYVRTDAASKRTVAFAFTKGYLLLATRDDLVAQALELMGGSGNPSIASDRWYRDATAAASTPGELRLVMNLESLVNSVYFRSYWVQRNASLIRQYWAGVADVKRTNGNVTESRVFLRAPDAAQPPVASPAMVSNLLTLVPAEAGLYKALRISDPGDAAALIVQKLIAHEPARARDWRDAPSAVSPDINTGNEGDLETRIDEQPLPSDSGLFNCLANVRAMVEQSGARTLLLVQSSAPAGGTFVQTPSVIVLVGAEDWDRGAIRTALTSAAGKLWSTSQLGAGWITETSGSQQLDQLDGAGTLAFAIHGKLIFLSNDTRLLQSVLARSAIALPAGSLTYAAGFRHLRERSNYERIMNALDVNSPATNGEFLDPERAGGAPPFFSGNIASLGHALASLNEVYVTEEERSGATVQTVVYRMGQ
jgi:hypothetical protein